MTNAVNLLQEVGTYTVSNDFHGPSILEKKPSFVLTYQLSDVQKIWFYFLLPVVVRFACFSFDLATDVALLVDYFRSGNVWCGALTIVFLYLPLLTFLLWIVTKQQAWEDKEGATEKCQWILLHTFHILTYPIWALQRLSMVLFWSIEALARTGYEREDALGKCSSWSYIEFYLLLQPFLQSAPQALFQTWMMTYGYKQGPLPLTSTVTSQAASIATSLFSLAITVTAFQWYESQKVFGRKVPWCEKEGDARDTWNLDVLLSSNRSPKSNEYDPEDGLNNMKTSGNSSSHKNSTTNNGEGELSKKKFTGGDSRQVSFSLEESTDIASTKDSDEEQSKSANVVADETDVCQEVESQDSDSDDPYVQFTREKPSTSLSPPVRPRSLILSPPPRPPMSDAIRRSLQRYSMYYPLELLRKKVFRTSDASSAVTSTTAVSIISSIQPPDYKAPSPPIERNRKQETDVVDSAGSNNNRALDISLPRKRTYVKGMDEDNPLGKVVAFLWWYFFISSRILALAVFCAFYPFAALALILAHVVTATTWLLCANGCSDCSSTLSLIGMGLLSLFCFIEYKTKHRNLPLRFLVFFLISFLENTISSAVWYNLEAVKINSINFWYYKFTYFGILGAYILSISSMVAYIVILKPKPKIKYLD